MPVSFSARMGKRGATARLKTMPKVLRQAQVQAMSVAVVMVEADLKTNSFTGKRGSDPFWGVTGAAGDALGVRSGHTRRSIVSRVFTLGAGAVVTGTVGSPLKYMKLHEEGGTVHGKPWLRIPTKTMQTPAGVDRMAGRSIRSITEAFLLKSKAGKLWSVIRDRAGQLVFLYLLVRSVRMRARRPFKASLDRTRTKVRALFSRGFSAAVRSA